MSATEQPIVSTRYVECEFPEQAFAAISAEGAKPLKAIVWRRETSVAFGMLSEDPSGPGGIKELHLSVSASDAKNGRRNPTDEEVSEACSAVCINIDKCQSMTQNGCTHVWASC
jgi:hypothetical protein